MVMLLIEFEETLYKYAEVVLLPVLKFKNLDVQIKVSDKEQSVFNSLMFRIYIEDDFLKEYLISSEDYKDFLDEFKLFLKTFEPIGKHILEIDGLPVFNLFSIIYRTEDSLILEYLFDFESIKDIDIHSFNSALDSIIIYNTGDINDFKTSVKRSYSTTNVKQLRHDKQKWVILDSALKVVEQINNDYRKDKDFRVKKPHVILNTENIHKKIIFDTNWVLEFSGLETLMVKPNDVSIYSNIANEKIIKAKEFYDNTILPRFNRIHGSFPSDKLQAEYYDYFELIISAVIFAFTSLEAFVNIFVPDVFEYVNREGNVVEKAKSDIERRYSLEEKFTKVLAIYLNTSNPKNEGWWIKFKLLKSIRDEIMHTKQSKSEERYSQLLSDDIFDVINVYKEIISYYGFYISKNKPNLINEYPYGFGYDNVHHGFITNQNYIQAERNLRMPNYKK